MTIYVINIAMIGVYSIFYNLLRRYSKSQDKLKKFFINISVLQLFLLLALRSKSVGVDANGYLSNFNFVKSSSFQELLQHRFEIGYKLLTKFISILTEKDQVFLSIIAGLSIIPVGRFIYKYSKKPFLSFAIYISFNFYMFTFSGLRQSIAFSIIYLSYDYIKQRKPLKFLLMVLLATSFHKSAIIFLPAYFITKIKLTETVISGFAFVDIFILVFKKQIMSFVTKHFFQAYEIVESLSVNWFLFSLFIFLVCLFFYKNVVKQDATSQHLYLLVATGISIMLLATVSTNAMRMANYYYVFVILLIPEVIASLKDSRLALLGGYLLITGIIMIYFWLLYVDGYGIVPYKFFWQ